MNVRRLLSSCFVATAFCLSSAAQANYDFTKLKRERLGRGVVAVRQSPTQVAVSWRYLSDDPIESAFNVYRNGEKIATVTSRQGTFFTDEYSGNEAARYEVKRVQMKDNKDGRERRNGRGNAFGKEDKELVGAYTLPANAPEGYVNIPLDKPADGETPDGRRYSYSANDASIGDVDGDGEYEIILKWEPSNAHDNAHDGYTGNVLFDCYRLTGERLWRIDMGRNIRAGAHYTQFMVFDLDGDGSAEVVMKTSDGTIDGQGKVIGNAKADYREKGNPRIQAGGDFPPGDPRGGYRRGMAPYNQGRILTGAEYLTVFNGLTGAAMHTIDYVPQRGNLADWGDTRANRSDRYLAAVAYLDGVHPSVVMCRGYYTRATLAAFDWDGKKLKLRWFFDSDKPENRRYAGQGNHNLRVGDVDGDGCDEIVYGSCTIDHDGTGLYTTRMGHGDAMHLTQFSPDIPGLQVWACHENRRDGSSFRDARTGKVFYQIKDRSDVGRCMAADIDPTNYGVEMWSLASGGIRNTRGELIHERVAGLSHNMAVWWDGDLQRELLNGKTISKYDPYENACKPLLVMDSTRSCNGSKSTPCLQGDITGDWREEVLMRTEDNSALRLYVSPIPTRYRFHTFLEDPVYRISIATQNVAYNQPTQPGFYFGSDLKPGIFRGYRIGMGRQGGRASVNDSNTPLHLMQPAYNVPYGMIDTKLVKADMDRILNYLDKNTPARLVDEKTGKEVTDYKKINADTRVEQGTFRLTSYEWGVTYSAILAAAEATGDKAYSDYADKRFRFLANVTPAFHQLKEKTGKVTPIIRPVIEPKALDDAGAVCAAMIKAQKADPSLPLRPLIDNYIDFIMNKEYRLADGTLARTRPQYNTLWLDDMFMGIPPLAHYSTLLKGDEQKRYMDEAVKQVRQFAKRMWVPEKNLFRHGWVESMEDHPAYHWGRANGWALLTLCEVLDVLPEDYAGRAEVLDLFRKHVRGLAALQSGEGFWHQLLDRNDSYHETSATAIYVYCIAHAINKGWLDPMTYGPVAQLGWHAVSTKITPEGYVEGTCVGTGMAFDPAFYYYRPVNIYAAHGYGPVLWAGAEMIKMLNSQHPKMNDSAVQFYPTEQNTDAAIFHATDSRGKRSTDKVHW